MQRDSCRFLLDICIIVAYILMFCWPLGAFGPAGPYSGFPKGDDAYTHATKIRFLLENWPHINWYPYGWSGFPYFSTYPPLAYYLYSLVAIISKSIEFSMFFLSALSYVLTGIGLYGFVYGVTENRISALITPIMLISSVAFLGPLLTGGAYTRTIATMFFSLSLWSALNYIKSLEDWRRARKFYLATVFLSTGVVASNALIGLFAVATVLFMFLFCIKGWKKGFFHAFKVLIPIALLSAFFYIPFVIFLASEKRYAHWFIEPSGLAPIPIDFMATSLAMLLGMFLPFWLITMLMVHHNIIKFEHRTSGVLKVLGAFVLFFFIYSCTDLPVWLRFFSTYDGDDHMSFYLAIVNGILLGQLFAKIEYQSIKRDILSNVFSLSNIPSIKGQGRRALPVITLLIVMIMPMSYYPLLGTHTLLPTVDLGSESWAGGKYVAQQLLNEVDLDGNEFRLASEWPEVHGWFNYKYNFPQIMDRHYVGNPYPLWVNWFKEAVWRSRDNYQETNFLLDWYAINYLILSDRILATSTDKFLNKIEYYKKTATLNTPDRWGTTYLFKYKFATPIVSPTNTTTFLVLGKNAVYDGIFRLLAYSNYNTHYIIPIRGDRYVDDYSFEELRKFDVIFVTLNDDYSRNFENAWKLLNEYIQSGGGLIIDTGYSDAPFIPLPSPVSEVVKTDRQEWNFTHIEHQTTKWVDFMKSQPPLSFSLSFDEAVRPWARTVIWSHDLPIVVVGEYGKGRVAWTGLNFPYQMSISGDLIGSLFFSSLIDWISSVPERFSSVVVSPCESTLDWIKEQSPNTDTILEASNERVMSGRYSLKAEYKFNGKRGEFVAFKYDPAGSWDLTDKKFLSLWVYGDNSSHYLKVVILAPDWNNYLQTYIRIDWNGWKKILLSIDDFGKSGSPALNNVNAISLIVDASVEDETWHYTYLDDIRVIRETRFEEQVEEEYGYMIDRLNAEAVKVKIDEFHRGVLLKESYSENWHAYIVDKEGARCNLHIYRVGPDFKYVYLPQDTKFPAEVVFEYTMTEIEWFSYLASVSTLVFLVIYGLGLSVDRPVTYTLTKAVKLRPLKGQGEP